MLIINGVEQYTELVDLLETSLGDNGSKEITGTNAVTPTEGNTFTAVNFIIDSTVSAYTDVAGYTSGDLTAITYYPAGAWVYGKWSSITLSDGEGMGYYSA